MNLQILKKVIGALNESEPKLDYVRGMLETLYEIEALKFSFTSDGSLPTDDSRPIEIGVIRKDESEEVDEAAILDARARAAIADVKAMADASTHE